MPTAPPATRAHARSRSRSHSVSLSIARSPSVLSSGLFLTHTPANSLDPESQPTAYGLPAGSDDPLAHPHNFAHHPYAPASLRRVVSAGAGQGLEPIRGEDEDDKELELDLEFDLGGSSSAPHLPLPNDGITEDQQPSTADASVPTSDAPTPTIGYSRGGIRGESLDLDDDNLDDTTSQPLLSQHGTRKVKQAVKFQPVPLSSSSGVGPNTDGNTNVEYDGPFQPPDSKELLGILLSCVGVVVLAVAAGCTTIFDWVL